MIIRRKSTVRIRSSRGQGKLACAVAITISYALTQRSGQERLLRTASPQIVHEVKGE